MEKRVTYDNAIPPGCQCQPEERESPGAEDTLWAVRASFEIQSLEELDSERLSANWHNSSS